jgi:hypothetical protein
VREKSRFRLYSASGFAVRLADFFRAAAFFAADDLVTEVFFAAEVFLTGDVLRVEVFFVAFAPVFALFFFATGRFTVRFRVVAMVAPGCEEHADELRDVGMSGCRDVGRSEARRSFPSFHLLVFPQ